MLTLAPRGAAARRAVPVHADGTQVENGRRAQHHVHGHQAIAQQQVQGPNAPQELWTGKQPSEPADGSSPPEGARGRSSRAALGGLTGCSH